MAELDLGEIRAKLDDIDKKISDTFEERMNLCKKVRIIRFLFILQSNHLSQNCHAQKC